MGIGAEICASVVAEALRIISTTHRPAVHQTDVPLPYAANLEAMKPPQRRHIGRSSPQGLATRIGVSAA